MITNLDCLQGGISTCSDFAICAGRATGIVLRRDASACAHHPDADHVGRGLRLRHIHPGAQLPAHDGAHTTITHGDSLIDRALSDRDGKQTRTWHEWRNDLRLNEEGRYGDDPSVISSFVREIYTKSSRYSVHAPRRLLQPSTPLGPARPVAQPPQRKASIISHRKTPIRNLKSGSGIEQRKEVPAPGCAAC